MFDGDLICRSALFPRFNKDGIFDEAALLDFQSNKDKTVYALSVASRFLLEGEKGAHCYGVNAAVLANIRLAGKLGREPEPIKEKVHYLGFYDFYYAEVDSIKMDHYEVRVVWRPEESVDQHFHIEFIRRRTEASHKQLSRERMGAIGVLATYLKGPIRAIDPNEGHLFDDLMSIYLKPCP